MTALRFFCFWPGLASAWYHGSARGLFVAVLFAWSLCLLLLASIAWPGWFSGWFLKSIYAGAFIFWLLEFVWERLLTRGARPPFSDAKSDQFVSAQAEYLQGNWFEAEAILLNLTKQDPSDISAGLLLVGVLKHTHRPAAALHRLEQLCLYDASASWRFEIEREKRLILQAADRDPENEEPEEAD